MSDPARYSAQIQSLFDGAEYKDHGPFATIRSKEGDEISPPEVLAYAAPSNRDGFWEDAAFVELNDEILDALYGAWDVPPVQRWALESGCSRFWRPTRGSKPPSGRHSSAATTRWESFEFIGFSANEEFAAWDTALRDGDQVVFIPPVAGG